MWKENKMSSEIDRKPIMDDNGNIVGWLRIEDKTFEEIEKELKDLKGEE